MTAHTHENTRVQNVVGRIRQTGIHVILSEILVVFCLTFAGNNSINANQRQLCFRGTHTHFHCLPNGIIVCLLRLLHRERDSLVDAAKDAGNRRTRANFNF